MSQTLPKPTAKMECLEGIRGLAALAVVVGHLLLAFWPGVYFRSGPLWAPVPTWIKALAQFPGKFLWDGHAAVSVFFVLSGFVLSLAFFERGSIAGLGSAALRRYPRLMFPVCASVLLAYILLASGAMANQAAVQAMTASHGLEPKANAPPGHSFAWLGAYYGFSPRLHDALNEGTHTAFMQTSNYNLVLWTMPIELVGSFLVFGSLALFGTLRNRWLLYAIGGGLLLLFKQYYYLDFMLGMALCDLWVWNQRTRRWELPRWFALLVLAGAIFGVAQKPLASTMIVGSIVFCGRLQPFFDRRWVRFLGQISFGVYLIHMPIICSLGAGLYLALTQRAGWSHDSGALLAGTVTLAVCLAGAWFFYHVIDRPTLALIRWVDQRLFRPAPMVPKPSPAVLPLARSA